MTARGVPEMSGLVLGINGCSHNTSAALIGDGEMLAHVEEERFNREKHSMAWPRLSVEYCLKHAGATMADVDMVALAGRPRNEILWSAALGLRHFGRTWYRRFLRNQILVTGLYKGWREKRMLREKLGYRGPIRYVEHHLSHAASAFLVSPYERAGIMTVDAQGDGLASALYLGEGSKIRRVARYLFPRASLGHFYDCIGEFIGMKAIRDAGKTMGLASYGDPAKTRELLANIVSFEPGGRIRFDLDWLKDGSGEKNAKRFRDAYGPPRRPDEPITDPRFADLAAGAQEIVEKAFFHLAGHLKETTGCEYLCLAGGVALNSVANGKLDRSGMFTDTWIQPSANDAGLSIGAAFYAYNSIRKNPRVYEMKHAYYGPGYTTAEVRAALDIGKITYREVDDPSRAAAELVAQDKIVGWFQGRMEAGPRALGNRSILSNPMRADMKDIVNRYVKHREPYRPFAPSALEEHAAEYFDNRGPNPFMLKVVDVRPEARSIIPAITHVDGSGRLQTVTRDVNERYWRMIDELRKITGVPVVMNTSFNIRGEPIVTTPQDALKCYYTTGLDALVLDRFVVEKGDGHATERTTLAAATASE